MGDGVKGHQELPGGGHGVVRSAGEPQREELVLRGISAQLSFGVLDPLLQLWQEGVNHLWPRRQPVIHRPASRAATYRPRCGEQPARSAASRRDRVRANASKFSKISPCRRHDVPSRVNSAQHRQRVDLCPPTVSYVIVYGRISCPLSTGWLLRFQVRKPAHTPRPTAAYGATACSAAFTRSSGICGNSLGGGTGRGANHRRQIPIGETVAGPRHHRHTARGLVRGSCWLRQCLCAPRAVAIRIRIGPQPRRT